MSIFLQWPRCLVFVMLISLASVSAVFCTPALPELARVFHLTASQNQWVMSLYLWGYAIGPLCYGPIANKIGRKKTIFIGISVCLLGTFISLFADASYTLFCLGRFLQAVGASVGFKIVFTMIGDLETGAQAAKTFTWMFLGNAIIPSITVAIGGLLTTAFGWKGCFVFLALYSAALLWMCRSLPETAKVLQPDALALKRIAQGYLEQFKNRSLVIYGLLAGVGTSMLYVFANEAPYLAIDWMKLSPDTYGFFNLFLPLGMASGLMSANAIARHVKKLGVLLFLGLAPIGLAVCAMAVLFGAHWYTGWSLFLPQLLMLFGVFFMGPFLAAQFLSDAVDKSNASASFQFINLGFTALATMLFGAWLPKTPFAFCSAFVALAVCLAWLCVRALSFRPR